MCIRVDLPEPEGPMMATYSPVLIVRLTPRSAATAMEPGAVDLGHLFELDDRRPRDVRRPGECAVGSRAHPPPPVKPPPPRRHRRTAAAVKPPPSAEAGPAVPVAAEEPPPGAPRAAGELDDRSTILSPASRRW